MGCAGSSSKDAVDDKPQGGGGEQGYQDGEEEDYQPLTAEEVNARIQCCDKAQHFTIGKSGLSLKYAYLSQRGYYPEDLYKANQDAFKVIPAFDGDPNHFFMGVFDGHGSDGDACSYFVRDNIEEHLKDSMPAHQARMKRLRISEADEGFTTKFTNCRVLRDGAWARRVLRLHLGTRRSDVHGRRDVPEAEAGHRGPLGHAWMWVRVRVSCEGEGEL